MSGPRRRAVARALAGLAAALLTRAAGAQGVLPDEVPFITTPDHVTLVMLRIAQVGRDDTVLDLGSGDGRIPITAARRFGARGIGVEIDPALVAKSRANARRAGVADRVTFHDQDLFAFDLGVASVITLYLLPELNLKLRPALLALAPGTRIVSHDWDMGDWAPDRTRTVAVPDKAIGREKTSRVHLWVVPARLHGTWCARAGARRAELAVEQRFQQVRLRIVVDGVVLGDAVEGHIVGASLAVTRGADLPASRWRFQAGAAPRLELQRGGGRALAAWRGVAFTPAATQGCAA